MIVVRLVTGSSDAPQNTGLAAPLRASATDDAGAAEQGFSLRRLADSSNGNMTILMMGAIGLAAFITAGVIDFMSLTNQKQSLQSVADHAALAAAQELIVSAGTDERVTAVAQRFVDASYSETHTTTAEIIDDGRAVRVSIVAAPRTFFPGPISSGVSAVGVEATAEVFGGGNVCMIGLDPESVATLNMMNRARLTAKDCAIYSNSVSTKSLWLHDLARVNAGLICVAGGFQGTAESFSLSPPTADCPPIDDPLRDRPDPDVGSQSTCDRKFTMVPPTKTVTLKPGVYCGGISVMGGQVTLEPGVYVMKNGQLMVAGGGSLHGENVGFFLTGASSTIMFGRDSHISLTAPKADDMAGLLFFEDRDTKFATYHQITSRDARRLVGTMYLPKSKLLIDANNPVADQSEYTVIIAREFELRDGPELVLNTDYASSPIPVPEGVGNNTDATVRLTN